MLYWFEVEGLTYALETLDDYKQHFRDCGYVEVEFEDASDWINYRGDAVRTACFCRFGAG